MSIFILCLICLAFSPTRLLGIAVLTLLFKAYPLLLLVLGGIFLIGRTYL